MTPPVAGLVGFLLGLIALGLAVTHGLVTL